MWENIMWLWMLQCAVGASQKNGEAILDQGDDQLLVGAVHSDHLGR